MSFRVGGGALEVGGLVGGGEVGSEGYRIAVLLLEFRLVEARMVLRLGGLAEVGGWVVVGGLLNSGQTRWN